MRFKSENYFEHQRFGWANPNQDLINVDLVGHSWFFSKQMIQAFWSIPTYTWETTAGEDIHFAFAVQSILGLDSAVPPHPSSQVSLWGASPKTSWSIGRDGNAVSLKEGAGMRFQRAFRHYLARGWRIHSKGIDASTQYKVPAALTLGGNTVLVYGSDYRKGVSV